MPIGGVAWGQGKKSGKGHIGASGTIGPNTAWGIPALGTPSAPAGNSDFVRWLQGQLGNPNLSPYSSSSGSRGGGGRGGGASRVALRDQALAEKQKIDEDTAITNQLWDIWQQQWLLKRQAAQGQADASKRGLESSATARGAYTTQGFRDSLKDLADQLARSMTNSDLEKRQQQIVVWNQLRDLNERLGAVQPYL